MNIYLLICEQDTDCAWGADVKVFSAKGLAQAEMKKAFEKALKDWEFDTANQDADYSCDISDDTASIRDGQDVIVWHIEEKSLDIGAAVEVKGGMVRSVYANADISVTVCDLDVSEYPDVGEQAEADRRERELRELVGKDGWRAVW